MRSLLGRAAAQALLYAAFLGGVGYFASRPQYHQLAPGQALIRLTVSHAAQPAAPCRKRTPEELAKLAPNMRAPLDCPRARAPVTLELALDDAPVERIVAQASGLAHDGPATIYRRVEVPAGAHRIRARLADNAAGRFDHDASRTLELAAGRVLTIDFNAAAGGFIFIE
jgi:hypothetical protein